MKTYLARTCNQKREQNTWGKCLRLVRGENAPPERALIVRNVFIKGKIFRKNNKTAKKNL